MILKQPSSDAPRIADLQRLLAQNPPSDVARKISSDLDKVRKGREGEMQVARHLNRHYAPCDKTAILHDIELEVHGQRFQIDHLLISRTLGLAIVYETKSWNGSLKIDDHGEWNIHYGDKNSIVVENPLVQAGAAAGLFDEWLKEQGWTVIKKVISKVVLSTAVIVDWNGVPDKERVLRSDSIVSQFNAWVLDHSLIDLLIAWRQWESRPFREADLRRLGHEIANAHAPTWIDYEKRYRWKALREPDGSPASRESDFRRADKSARHLELDEVEVPAGIQLIHNVQGVALRTGSNEKLKKAVRDAIGDDGQWNQQYENYNVIPARLRSVIERIRANIG